MDLKIMKIEQKLKLSTQHNKLYLFKEGVFLRAYNQSCYILTSLLGHDLKIQIKLVKKAPHSMVAMCSFPCLTLIERLPNAVETSFGAQLVGAFNLQGYDDWFEDSCGIANRVCAAAAVREKDALASAARTATKWQPSDHSADILLAISVQQANYLHNWQKGAYPLEVDLGFIESLKMRLLAFSHQRQKR